MRHSLLFFSLLATIQLTACSNTWFPGVFKINIGQGNIIEQAQLNKLQLGMTKQQVRYVMGSPMLLDPFHPDRWDYIFHLKMGNGERSRAHVVLQFDGNRLSHIDQRDDDGIRPLKDLPTNT